MNTIKKQWESYRKNVIPHNAPKVQVKECQLAFHAGATSMFNVAIAGLNDLTEDEAMQHLTNLREELNTFLKNFKEQHGIKD